jgi:hypothetical protein
MKTPQDCLRGPGMAVFSEIDNQFNYEALLAVRNDNNNDDMEKRLTDYAGWLKKALPDYIDATLEKYLHLITGREK